MSGHRRTGLQDRGPGIDLFDDPPWERGHERRTVLSWLGHVGFVAFLVFLGLLGLMIVVGLVTFGSLVSHFSLGHINVPSLPPPAPYGIDIALSPDGSRAYVTEPALDRLVVLDTTSGATVAQVPAGNTPSGVAVTPDGSQVWVVDTGLAADPTGAAGAANAVTVISTTTNAVIGTVPVGSGPIDVAFSPDGHWAYVTNNGGGIPPGSVNVVNTATLGTVETITPTTWPSAPDADWNPTSVALSPDGRQVWVSEVDDLASSPSAPNFVYVFDTRTTDQLAKIPVGTAPFFMVLSADGRYAYVADKVSCDVRQIDTTTFAVVATVKWPSSHGCPFGLATSADDNVVYAVTGDDATFHEGAGGSSFGSVDFATSQAVVHDNIGADPVTVILSPDHQKAYVVDGDRPVIDVVDPLTGKITSTMTLL